MMFFTGSRYEDVPTLEHVDDDGRVVAYKGIRFTPETEGLVKHSVDEGERLDHIAFQHYQDPERFWRLCDANLAVHPDELTERPGRILHIPPPER